jgi:anthraniloyl-CoA monooxygenase
MRVVIVGAGPAGLYCGLLLKKADPSRQVTIIERNAPDATYGWGVVFSDRTLASFREADSPTYTHITDRFVLWDAIDIRIRDAFLRCGGHVFAGIARKELLSLLQRRCAELGVAMRFHTEVTDATELEAADIVIAADGVNSTFRSALSDALRPHLEMGRAHYIWLGTTVPFDAFTFIFRENSDGFFQVHAYPFAGTASTFIVECDEQTWRRAGLHEASEAESIGYCERLFADDLKGHHLLGNNSRWISFATVTCRRWHERNVVLLGDAAHTAHFSIGSGTKLAMEDAISLARAVDTYGPTGAALTEYELERKPVVETLQAAARESQSYFERVRSTARLAPVQFSFHLLTRSGRVTYDDVRTRDPDYMETVDRWYTARETSAALAPWFAPPPLFTPLRLRELAMPNRIVMACTAVDLQHDSVDSDLADQATRGAGLVLTPPVAISAEGRISADDPGLYVASHQRHLAEVTSALVASGRSTLGLMLNHAGRRGATRPRSAGLDRPLGDSGWPLVSASPLPYTTQSQMPRALDRDGMSRVRDDFVQATKMAADANVDLLLLHMGHGYLLASFLTPLANRRDDEFGGGLGCRLRFPIEVFDAVRSVWPENRPLGVALTATDWASGGLEVEEGIAIARSLKEHGCDLIQVLAGQNTSDYEPVYGRGFLTTLSDRVRNEAGVATMVGGYLTTTDEANTILAAGRADLCILQPPVVSPLDARVATQFTMSCSTAQTTHSHEGRTRKHQQAQVLSEADTARNERAASGFTGE